MLEELLSSHNAPLRRLSLSRLKMARGDKLEDAGAGGLRLLYIRVGSVDVAVGELPFSRMGEHQSIRPSDIVVSSSSSLSIIAISAADILVAQLADGRCDHALLVRPSDVREYAVGKDHYRRIVREVVGGDSPCELKCGETLNALGAWSSWPPHDFERKPELAPQFEECFYYFGKTPESVGYQRRKGTFVTGEMVDDVCIVRPGDCLPIPLGEHPIVGAPDSQIGYVWFYYSPQAKHYAQQADGSWLYD